jgi:hypothetical protein
MSKHIPYSKPYRRPLSDLEKRLLAHILAAEHPERLAEINALHVVARCGCGQCPTVLFGQGPDADPVQGPEIEISSYRGRNIDGIDVAVTLLERDGKLAELEAWAPVGGDIRSWPPVSALAKFDWNPGKSNRG